MLEVIGVTWTVKDPSENMRSILKTGLFFQWNSSHVVSQQLRYIFPYLETSSLVGTLPSICSTWVIKANSFVLTYCSAIWREVRSKSASSMAGLYR